MTTARAPEARTDLPEPEYGRVPDAVRHFGLSRSRLYILARDGLIRLIREPGSQATIVDYASVRRHLAACRAADITLPRTTSPARSYTSQEQTPTA